MINTLEISKRLNRRHRDVMVAIEKTKHINEVKHNSYTASNGKVHKMYDIPINSAIGFIDGLRNNTVGRIELLQELYALAGSTVIVQGEERRELEFVRELQDALKEFNIYSKLQYKVKQYRIDLFVPSMNIAIEFDEYHHNAVKDSIREKIIVDTLKCKFVRIPDSISLGSAIGKVMKSLL